MKSGVWSFVLFCVWLSAAVAQNDSTGVETTGSETTGAATTGFATTMSASPCSPFWVNYNYNYGGKAFYASFEADLDTCCATCSGDPNCQAWAWALSWCYLKSTIGGSLTPVSGMICGIVPPSTTEYVVSTGAPTTASETTGDMTTASVTTASMTTEVGTSGVGTTAAGTTEVGTTAYETTGSMTTGVATTGLATTGQPGGAPCAPYWTYVNYNYGGKAFYASFESDLGTCCSTCSGDPSCNAYAWDGSWCYLKSAVGGSLTYLPGITSGVSKYYPPPSVASTTEMGATTGSPTTESVTTGTTSTGTTSTGTTSTGTTSTGAVSTGSMTTGHATSGQAGAVTMGPSDEPADALNPIPRQASRLSMGPLIVLVLGLVCCTVCVVVAVRRCLRRRHQQACARGHVAVSEQTFTPRSAQGQAAHVVLPMGQKSAAPAQQQPSMMPFYYPVVPMPPHGSQSFAPPAYMYYPSQMVPQPASTSAATQPVAQRLP